ncbi:nucleoside triphosphate pyrophosphatase [Kosmotoga sp.]|nr:nucleoside triphosphate pyrophosphatase [Kosmotoga sp.]
MATKIILASTSPRRKQLMKFFGTPFKVISPDNVDESLSAASIIEDLKEVALKKARNVLPKISDIENSIVIGADTVVMLEGEILLKPKNTDEAYRHLKRLSGAFHDVYTGVGIITSHEEFSFVEITRVKFRVLDDATIYRYIETGIPMDKAGAYGIQDFGALFVEKIEGDFYNVMGLPIGRIWYELRNRGYEF